MSEEKPIDIMKTGVNEEATLLCARGYIIDAQKHIYSAVNFSMVTAYWNIGKLIYTACGENERAEY
jgi:hypothetical protein